MPIYEYVCQGCGKEFEAMQKFSDAPLSECSCGKQGHVERKLSLSAFQLKGGGWFKQGYAANGGSNGSSASSSDTNGSSDSSSGGSCGTSACSCAAN